MLAIDLDKGIICGKCKAKDIKEKGLIRASIEADDVND